MYDKKAWKSNRNLWIWDGLIDEKDHAYILANIVAIGTELNWDEAEVLAAVEELERFGLVEIAEKSEEIKLYLKRFV